MKKLLAVIGIAAATLAGAHAQAVSNVTFYWNGNTTIPTTTTLSVNGTYFASDPTFSQFNNFGTTTLITSTSPSSGYTGASGGNNFGLAVGTLNSATPTPFSATGPAFAFSISLLDPAFTFTLSTFDFGSRRTATGPQALRLVASNDAAFTSPFTVFDITSGQTSGAWVLNQPTINSFTSTGNQSFFRLYAYNGTGNATSSTANWRIDDVTLTGSVIPEPSTYALIGLGIAGMIFMVRRRRRAS